MDNDDSEKDEKGRDVPRSLHVACALHFARVTNHCAQGARALPTARAGTKGPSPRPTSSAARKSTKHALSAQCHTWLRTIGVNTNGAAAKVIHFDRLR